MTDARDILIFLDIYNVFVFFRDTARSCPHYMYYSMYTSNRKMIEGKMAWRWWVPLCEQYFMSTRNRFNRCGLWDGTVRVPVAVRQRDWSPRQRQAIISGSPGQEMCHLTPTVIPSCHNGLTRGILTAPGDTTLTKGVTYSYRINTGDVLKDQLEHAMLILYMEDHHPDNLNRKWSEINTSASMTEG